LRREKESKEGGLNSFLERNCCGLLTSALLVVLLSLSLLEAFDKVLYSNWWRQNIHLFTPLPTVSLLFASHVRRENFLVLLVNLVLLAVHYYFLWFIFQIGRGGAAVFRLL